MPHLSEEAKEWIINNAGKKYPQQEHPQPVKKDKNGMMIDENGKYLDFSFTSCDVCTKKKQHYVPFHHIRKIIIAKQEQHLKKRKHFQNTRNPIRNRKKKNARKFTQ